MRPRDGKETELTAAFRESFAPFAPEDDYE